MEGPGGLTRTGVDPWWGWYLVLGVWNGGGEGIGIWYLVRGSWDFGTWYLVVGFFAPGTWAFGTW